MIDLFTWMHDRYRSYVENPQTSRLVVGWFEGSDGSGDVIAGTLSDSHHTVFKLDTIHNLGLYYVNNGQTLAGVPPDGGPSHLIQPRESPQLPKPTNLDYRRYPRGLYYAHNPTQYDKVVYIPHCRATQVINPTRAHPTTTIAHAFTALLTSGCYDTNDGI